MQKKAQEARHAYWNSKETEEMYDRFKKRLKLKQRKPLKRQKRKQMQKL